MAKWRLSERRPTEPSVKMPGTTHGSWATAKTAMTLAALRPRPATRPDATSAAPYMPPVMPVAPSATDHSHVRRRSSLGRSRTGEGPREDSDRRNDGQVADTDSRHGERTGCVEDSRAEAGDHTEVADKAPRACERDGEGREQKELAGDGAPDR